MADGEWLATEFEANRERLRAVAYRMLGSRSEADDAVQECWLRLSRSGASGVENLAGWLTTVVGRVCLDMLRTRSSRREEPLDRLPEPALDGADAVEVAGGVDPEREAMLADSIGVALLVVLDTLAPAERLAFVLHDLFDVPFEEIAAIVDRSPAAARQLASRARRRVRGAAHPGVDIGPDRKGLGSERRGLGPDREGLGRDRKGLARQRELVAAFLAASRHGDFGALLELLDPGVVVRADSAAVPVGAPTEVRGAAAVARQALTFSQRSRYARLALVDGATGIVVEPRGRVAMVLAFTVERGKIASIEVIADRERLQHLDVAVADS